MNQICAIYDTDAVYAKRLMGLIIEKKMVPFGVWVFTKKDEMLAGLQRKEISLLVTTEEEMSWIREEYAGEMLILTENEQQQELGKGKQSCYKYQQPDRIVRIILDYFGRDSVSEQIPVLGIFSLGNVQERSAFALEAARISAEEYKTLYVNLEEFSGLEKLLPASHSKTLSDLLYEYRQRNGQLSERMQDGICSVQGFDYIPPVRCADDISDIDCEQILQMIQQLAKQQGYERILLDIGQGVSKAWKLLGNCADIYFVTQKDAYADSRRQSFEIYFIESGMEDVLEHIREVCVTQVGGRIDGDFWTSGEDEISQLAREQFLAKCSA